MRGSAKVCNGKEFADLSRNPVAYLLITIEPNMVENCYCCNVLIQTPGQSWPSCLTPITTALTSTHSLQMDRTQIMTVIFLYRHRNASPPSCHKKSSSVSHCKICHHVKCLSAVSLAQISNSSQFQNYWHPLPWGKWEVCGGKKKNLSGSLAWSHKNLK